MLFRTTLTILFLILIGMPATMETSGHPYVANAQRPQKLRPKLFHYACPMHPEVTSGRPGKCPKCGMTLRVVKGPLPDRATAVVPAVPVAAANGEAAALSSARIPNANVYDQNGKPLKFARDLIKGKTVAINFIFTTCTGVCPPLTATFRRLQQELNAQNLPVELISISVDPTIDTPERLRDFAAKFKAGPGWTFVTGDKTEIDSILRALGTAVANKTDHTPTILIGNDVSGYWTRTYGLSSPASLMKVITEVAARK